ncbi:hypothetical protein PIB30_102702 [Stylosanthes scabra]|uniref:Putative plant transposon protein domain-containing protein n=1 Tax=Stylosanthes scabra TaxID=79078 RepID=A0ABU6XWY5_9FABA|nr:hypothetical protein [Stylosanthes scabra]
MLSARRIFPELILQADEDVFNPIRYQIYNRKWEKFTKPIQAVGHLMVKEFYANAWESDKAKRKHPTYTSSVRGTEVSFAPSNIKRVLKLKSDPYPNAPSYHERRANKDYRLDHILEDMCEEDAQWVCHRDGRPHYLRRSDLEPMQKIRAIPNDTLIPQEPPIVAEAMVRTREPRARARQATHPQQPPQQHEENRRSFEAINTRMDRMDDQLSLLCYSNQMANEQMLSPYQNTARQFKEMEMQGIPVTMANLAIHRQREEANKGKAKEIVPDSEDSEDTFVSSESEEFQK